jgi:hypothetical protein
VVEVRAVLAESAVAVAVQEVCVVQSRQLAVQEALKAHWGLLLDFLTQLQSEQVHQVQLVR